MKYQDLLARVRTVPVFDTGFLLAGETSPAALRVQLARWVRAGKLVALRKGLYAVAPPYRAVEPHPFELANALHRGSVVSLQSALAHAGWIPEALFAVTSVGPGRGETISTPLGRFRHVHLKAELLFAYDEIDLGAGRVARVAWPEKAILDWVHLTPGGDDPAFLRSLRLTSWTALDDERLDEIARRAGRPKWTRAVAAMRSLAAEARADEGRDP